MAIGSPGNALPLRFIPHQLPYLQANNDLPPCACQPEPPGMSGSLPFQILPPSVATSLSVCNRTPPRNDSSRLPNTLQSAEARDDMGACARSDDQTLPQGHPRHTPVPHTSPCIPPATRL